MVEHGVQQEPGRVDVIAVQGIIEMVARDKPGKA
jgi:hypothetical protein